MLSKDVQIGATYRCRVSDRLALVTVARDHGGRGRRYECVTQDTGRTIRASAARLRPLPGTAEAAAEASRRAAAAAAAAPRPFAGAVGIAMVDPQPVPEMLRAIGPAPIQQMSEPNRDSIRRIVDRVHVAEPFAVVARAVRRRIGSMVIWNTIPRAMRRGILYEAATRHAAGRRMYRVAMGHDPLPSPRMVADAVGVACGLGACPR
ncbi:MAG: hypothetical protein EBS51_14460 [Planctomycetia bacterium]|nr:hypothetical protein [Planctomycetia bacterium]